MLIVLRCGVLLFVCIVLRVDGSPKGIQYRFDAGNESVNFEQFIDLEGTIISNNRTQFSWTLYKGNKTYIEDEEAVSFNEHWDNINTLFVAIAATVSLVLLVGCPLLCIKKNGKKESNPDVERGLNLGNCQTISTINGAIITSPVCQFSNPKRRAFDKPPSYEAAIHLAVIVEEEEADELPSYQEALELQLAQTLTKLKLPMEIIPATPIPAIPILATPISAIHISDPPILATPILAAPIPTTPIPATPIPSTPIPAIPILATPIPAIHISDPPILATPILAAPIPTTPIPATPSPATPIPATPIPATPIPVTPIPATLIPATPILV